MARSKHVVFGAVALTFMFGGTFSLYAQSAKDLAALGAKQHPGQEWGYLNLQELGEDFENASNGWSGVIKVPSSAQDGTQIEIPVSSGSMNAKTHDFFRAVRGVLHRSQGTEGTDVLEVTALKHDASRSGIAEPWMNTAGWVTVQQAVPLIH